MVSVCMLCLCLQFIDRYEVCSLWSICFQWDLIYDKFIKPAEVIDFPIELRVLCGFIMFSFCCIARYDWFIYRTFNGPGKIWYVVEVSGKNVMQTSLVVTTSVVTHR